MKCRDCENLVWGYDEGERVWWCRKHGYCPDLDVERSCSDFSLKKPDIFTALSTLQAENEKLRNEVERQRRSADDRKHLYENAERAYMKVVADLARVTAERDAAKEAVKNMAEYIVCAGRVDYFLCDEISQEHHLKYQSKNDGNYDNEPCYKCVADWFLQGHKWQGSNW